MIRVTVELIPQGRGQPELLGMMTITNNGRETFQTGGKLGTYSFVTRLKRSSWKRVGTVTGFPRKRKNVWFLIARCLAEAGLAGGERDGFGA